MLEKLMEKIDKNCNNVNKDFIEKAYNFAFEAHKAQKRESGEPYIIHPVEVACILAEMGLDTNTIAAGLLHDVIEDTKYTYDDILKEFGEEVALLVNGVTKLGKIEDKTKEEQQADNVRNMLLAMAKDVRVILIKLADRLHNMRTLRFKSVEKQKEKAKETLDIYAPLAHRLGMSRVKWELEDLAFRYLNPNAYYDLVNQISEKRVEREEYISKIVAELNDKLTSSGIRSSIDGRPKHFYSIYRKMVNKSKTLEQIFDLTAIRILVDTVKDCYAVLGIVHTMYKPIPGRFKDYIAMPKPNMYQSLHSTVIGPLGKPFEIQIRTFEMHRTAEYGIAAHWKYKEGINNSNDKKSIDLKLTWLREILDWQKETSNAQEFMEEFKIDLFSDEVFVFTPKGTVINLPNDSTPIDFAYRIHTDIGNRCVGAKVDGKMQPLDYHLKTGEIVEIVTSSVPKGPSIDWLNIAKSNQAKSKIRAWFKKSKKQVDIDKGKDLLEKESKREGNSFGEIARGQALEKLLKKYNMNVLDDLIASVGIGAVPASVVVAKLRELSGKGAKTESLKSIQDELGKSSSKTPQKGEKGDGVIVKGASNLLVRIAKCCNPVPGDDIVGYITRGRGVSVHRSDCANLKSLMKMEKGSKLIEVEWGKAKGDAYPAVIQVRSQDRNGLLTEIMGIMTDTNTHVYEVNAKSAKNSIAIVSIKISIPNVEHLRDLMKKIRKVKGVEEVYRSKF